MTLIVRNVVADMTGTRLHGKFSGIAGSEVALQSVLLLDLSFAASTTAPTLESSISTEVYTQTVWT